MSTCVMRKSINLRYSLYTGRLESVLSSVESPETVTTTLTDAEPFNVHNSWLGKGGGVGHAASVVEEPQLVGSALPFCCLLRVCTASLSFKRDA